MKSFREKFFDTICYLLIILIVCIVEGFVIGTLWNWLMPSLFGLGEITYWQAIGLFALAKLIFGFGFGGDNNSMGRRGRNARCGEDEPGENWTEYEAWWEAEGKSAFENYAKGNAGENSENR